MIISELYSAAHFAHSIHFDDIQIRPLKILKGKVDRSFPVIKLSSYLAIQALGLSPKTLGYPQGYWATTLGKKHLGCQRTPAQPTGLQLKTLSYQPSYWAASKP